MHFEKSGGYITIPDEYVVFTKKDKKDQFLKVCVQLLKSIPISNLSI